MKRFDFDGENYEDDEDIDDYNENGDEKDFFSMVQFPPMPEEADIMDQAIKICENNFFWKFKSIDSKLKDIKKTYDFLQAIVNDEFEPEGDKDAIL